MIRLLLLVLLVALLLVAAPSFGEPVTITTQNTRVTLGPAQARHDIRQAAEHSSIVFTQEMGLRRASRFAPPGWGSAHFAGPRRGDAATYWDRAVWHRVKAYLVPLTVASFRAGHRFALVVVLRSSTSDTTLATVDLHLITHGITASRRASTRFGTHRLVDALDRLRSRYDHVVVGGDWNIPWYVDRQKRLPGFPYMALRDHFTSRATPRTTSAGHHRLDYFYWLRPHDRFRSQRVVGHTYSDHDGDRLHLGLR